MSWFKRLFGVSPPIKFQHRHKFGQWAEITIPIGPDPYHTKEMMRTCIDCRGVEMMFGSNWEKCVPSEYKDQFIAELAKHNLHLLPRAD